jgi:hypothetical protein
MLDEDFIKKLKMQPQTYKTILGSDFDNRNTITNIVRKKLNSLVNYRFVCVGVLDGTRFGERIFYVLDKNYFIVIIRHHQKFGYFYCNDILEFDEDKLVLENAYKLNYDTWVGVNDFVINRDWLVRFF